MHLGVFWSFYICLFVISRVIEGCFSNFTLIFLWCMCPLNLNSAYDATDFPNLNFHHVLKSATTFSFSWCDAWQQLIDVLSLVVISFFFFLLFSLPDKARVFPLFFFLFQFQFLYFLSHIFISSLFRKVLYVFNSVLELEAVIYCFFQSSLYSCGFSFSLLTLFLKFYWFSISSFNQSLCCLIFSNLALILLISFSFCWSFFLFLFSSLTLKFNFFRCLQIYFFISIFTLILLIIFSIWPILFPGYILLVFDLFGIRLYDFFICHSSWFNDSGHKFSVLIQLRIIFFPHFFLMILSFYIIIFWKTKWLVVTFNFFLIGLSWSYYLDHEFFLDKDFFFKILFCI